MSYPLLEQAPANHNSTAFLDFLRANNTVVHENHEWLVIENCKYHMKDGNRGWHTAFMKSNKGWFIMQDNHYGTLKSVIIAMGYSQWEMRIKKPHDRTVARFHVHFIQ